MNRSVNKKLKIVTSDYDKSMATSLAKFNINSLLTPDRFLKVHILHNKIQIASRL